MRFLPLLNFVSIAFHTCIKFTSLSKKIRYKKLDPSSTKCFPPTSLDHFGSWTKCCQRDSNVEAVILPQWKFASPSNAEIFGEFAHQRIPLCLSL